MKHLKVRALLVGYVEEFDTNPMANIKSVSHIPKTVSRCFRHDITHNVLTSGTKLQCSVVTNQYKNSTCSKVLFRKTKPIFKPTIVPPTPTSPALWPHISHSAAHRSTLCNKGSKTTSWFFHHGRSLCSQLLTAGDTINEPHATWVCTL